MSQHTAGTPESSLPTESGDFPDSWKPVGSTIATILREISRLDYLERGRAWEALLGSDPWRAALKQAENEAGDAEIERRNIERVAKILSGSGWIVEREVCVALRDGNAGRVDLLVTHPDLTKWGHIEVKDRVGPFGKEYANATKQAADYVDCQTSDGRLVSWGAVYPVVGACHWPAARPENPYVVSPVDRDLNSFVSGVFEVMSKHFKVHAMFHTPRSDMPRGDALTLMYLNRHLIWQEGGRGFAQQAESWLCGKRQVGGCRR